MKKLPIPHLYLIKLVIFVGAAALSGCGGGGGGDDSTSSPIVPPEPTIPPPESTNAVPIASPSAVSTDENRPTDGTLIASDADGDPLTYSIITNGSLGTAVITNLATGAFTYTPRLNENGTDSFTFKANDGKADSNIAAVTVTIIPPINQPPVATGSCNTTLQAETFLGALKATDPDGNFLMYSFPGGSTDTTLTTAKGATVTITDQTTGAFTYVPDIAAGDKRGTDSFDFQVSDPDGGVSSATETVVIDQTIMPLGDSITQGSVFNGFDFGTDEFRVGYRKPLFDTLGASGYTFDFVGSLSNGSAVLVDFNHEGHGGYSAFDIAWGQDPNTEGVFNWLVDNPADVILLHAGTNDLINTNVSEIEDILNEIDRWENGADGNPATVILALIIDQVIKDNPLVAALNDDVKAMANLRIAAGDNIIIVDQQQAVNYDTDMSDNLHPNDNGYTKMAPVWFNALENVLDKCP